MLLEIPSVLSVIQLDQIKTLLSKGQYVDGRLSAGKVAKNVKNNQELSSDINLMNQLNNLVMGTLVQNPMYQAAVLPIKIATPFYARYTEGMEYGDHVDDPVMGPPQGRYRSDVSTTLFLNGAEEYEGGELVVHTAFGTQKIKLAAGHAVVYPSSSLHHVAKVTAGVRHVAVTWAQSMVRDPDKRELLFNLNQARESLLKNRAAEKETKQVDVAYVNLVRMWADT